MELIIHFKTLPQDLDLDGMKKELDYVLEDNGWLLGSRQEGQGGSVELELEDERLNPKYGILAVKNYLQQRAFAPDTTIELAGMPVGIYE